jgi:hypothetical protein
MPYKDKFCDRYTYRGNTYSLDREYDYPEYEEEEEVIVPPEDYDDIVEFRNDGNWYHNNDFYPTYLRTS